MQKTEKPPKRAETSSSAALLEKAPSLHKTIRSTEDFKDQLINTIQHYSLIAQGVQNTNVSDPLNEQLTGLQFCFEKVHVDSDQLISVAQGALAHMARTQSELEKDPQVRQDDTSKQALEKTQHALLAMHSWLSQYQSDIQQQKQYVVNGPAPQGYTIGGSSVGLNQPSTAPRQMATGTSKTGPYGSTSTTHVAPSVVASTTPIDTGILLQEYIAALNVTTVGSFLIALQNLNHFLTTNANIVISLQQFYGLFNQLDKTFQVLPEATTVGLPQRQIIANMVAINRQINQLYGFLMGRQII